MIAPDSLPGHRMTRTDRAGLMTPWSHRHAAFVAGLGTFGLSDGLITPVGKAMRCGSIIAACRVTPTPRAYGDSPYAYCLAHTKGTCYACMRRCPPDAITHEGHDKDACCDYVMHTTVPYIKEHYGIEAYGCGLCQTRVPCEAGIPPGLGYPRTVPAC